MASMKNKTLTIIGLGYIGLPTAAMFAKSGLKVYGYDINENIIEAINKGQILIEEPGLSDLVKEVVASGNLQGISSLQESDIFIISVPTPIQENKKADLSYVIKASQSILPLLKKGDIVILESTSPPETTEKVVKPILEESGFIVGEEVFLAYSPERVLPGKIIQELRESDRIIGGINETSANMVKDLYKLFVQGEIFITESKTAEMCKLMENTYRDVNIALVNELAKTCEDIGVNAWEVITLANRHPRVHLHQPGPGVGGHCLAVDPWFIVERQKNGQIIKNARDYNDSMPSHVFNKIKSFLPKGSETIGILGLTYKPNIGDMRESPIVDLVDLLMENTSYDLRLHDPYADKSGKLGNLMKDTAYDAIEGADLLVLAVNHKDYNDIDFERVYGLMNTKHIYDTRNFLKEEDLRTLGFKYSLLGRN